MREPATPEPPVSPGASQVSAGRGVGVGATRPATRPGGVVSQTMVRGDEATLRLPATSTARTVYV